MAIWVLMFLWVGALRAASGGDQRQAHHDQRRANQTQRIQPAPPTARPFNTQPDLLLELLIHTLKGNFIRGSHYPQDPRFLDRCDELGVLVWEEALAWGNSAPVLTEPAFLEAELATAHALVDRDVNHPSITLWGFFNEGESNRNESVPSYAAMASVFRSRDPTRLVTWADNKPILTGI